MTSEQASTPALSTLFTNQMLSNTLGQRSHNILPTADTPRLIEQSAANEPRRPHSRAT